MPTGRITLNTNWGPFSSTYLGLSHILEPDDGTMLDLALFTGRDDPPVVRLPESTFGYVPQHDGERHAEVHAVPEDVAPDYMAYGLRTFLDAHGDEAVARFQVRSENDAACTLTFHNRSDETRTYRYGLGLIATDGRHCVRLKEPFRPWWVPARDYTHIEAYRKTFGLGCRQCITRVFNWGIEEQTLAQAFGCWDGDRVAYTATLPTSLDHGYVYVRYVKYGTICPAWELRLNGTPTTFRFQQTWAIPGGGWGKNRDAYPEWRLLRVPVGALPEGQQTLELRPLDPPGNDQARLWIDGMLFSEGLLDGDNGRDELLPASLIDDVLTDTARTHTDGQEGCSSAFRVVIPGKTNHPLTITTDAPPHRIGDGNGSFLGVLRREWGLAPAETERDAHATPWARLDGAPITVPAGQEGTAHFTITFKASGQPEGGSAMGGPYRQASGITHLPSPISHDPSPITHQPSPLDPYADVMAHLRDVTLFNVNYPITLFGPPTPYYVPAKFFPIPYSWDGGFAAVGMATFAPDLALQQATFFLADKEHDFPMLFAGSPVPTPLYALWDVYQTTCDRDVLATTYAGARRMYDFYLGRTPGSVVNAHGDGMLSTYPYNYNLGIDDHPIQRLAEKQKITEKGLYSLILMAQILRLARMMRTIAWLTGREEDLAQYAADADLLAGIIDEQMWDADSGLYGWLYRTDHGVQRFVMEGCGGDRSSCAFLPLFAGQATHKERLLDILADPDRFQTPYGISSVDMSAPYYNAHGYWNGGIWPVMQWYLWRGVLEAGAPERAREVAVTILQTWQDCFTKDHYLGEHFNIAEARMNGVPNFAGLDAALLPMHAAYFTPYYVTARYDVALLEHTVDEANDTLRLKLAAPFLETPTHDLLVNMGQGNTGYAIERNGKREAELETDAFGHMALRLPRPEETDEIRIEPA